MAYLEIAALAGTPIATSGMRTQDLKAFDRLELSAIWVARNDPLSTLEPATGWRRRLAPIFGLGQVGPPLANEALEALRRAAVHAWNGLPLLPEAERLRLLEAGYPEPAYASVRSIVAEAQRAVASH